MENLQHPDLILAKRLLAGDEQAFRELFDGMFPRLFRFAMARLDGNRDEAAEVVQQTLCKAFEHIESYRGEASLYGWLCQIARNLVIDRCRERRHLLLLDDQPAIRAALDTLAAPLEDEPDKQAARQETCRLLQATLDHLPPRYGDVLEWKYVEGLAVKEIAARLAIGPKAAESLLTRARVAFREALDALGSVGDWRSASHD
jgi:RNA polymerase sigma-70 factor (ECF subfamily)